MKSSTTTHDVTVTYIPNSQDKNSGAERITLRKQVNQIVEVTNKDGMKEEINRQTTENAFIELSSDGELSGVKFNTSTIEENSKGRVLKNENSGWTETKSDGYDDDLFNMVVSGVQKHRDDFRTSIAQHYLENGIENPAILASFLGLGLAFVPGVPSAVGFTIGVIGLSPFLLNALGYGPEDIPITVSKPIQRINP